MIVLDASVVIAHLSGRDAHHAAATAYLRELADERLVMHRLHLAEVLVGGVRAETGLRLPDCCALDAAIVHRATLATFDQDLAAAATARHLRVGPDHGTG